MQLATRDRRSAPLLVALIAVTALMNLNLLESGFLSWDDALLVTENARVQIPSLAQVWRVFSPEDALTGRTLEFLPLRDLIYALLFHFFGLWAPAFHLVQIAIHLAVCGLVFVVGRAWIGETASLIGAALFAVHPVHVESVAWIAALKDPAFTACALLSITFFGRFIKDSGGARAYALAMVMMIAALGMKQIAIVVPPLLGLIDLCFTRRPMKSRAMSLIPFFVAIGLALPFYVVVGARNQVLVKPPGGTPLSGAMTMIMVYGEYLLKMVAPWPLSPRYVVVPVLSPFDPRFLAAVAAIVAVAVAAIAVRRRSVLPLFALGWFTISLLPVMNIIPIPIEMADRYLYLPSIGPALAAGAGLARLLASDRPGLRSAATAAALAIGIAFIGLSVAQNQVWEDDITLWSAVLERSPEFYIGRVHLAAALMKKGEPLRAEQELDLAIRTNPLDATAYLDRGTLLRSQGRLDEAEAAFRRAVELRPGYAKGYNNLASVLMDRQRWGEAREALEQAIAIAPEYPTAHRNLALVCSNLEETDCALDHMRRAIDARPADRELFLDWLRLLEKSGRAADVVAWRERIQQHFAGDTEIQQRYDALVRSAPR